MDVDQKRKEDADRWTLRSVDWRMVFAKQVGARDGPGGSHAGRVITVAAACKQVGKGAGGRAGERAGGQAPPRRQVLLARRGGS